MQRIEHYKQTVSREELLRLAGEEQAALDDGSNEQFVLTEVLMGEIVDAAIRKRLKLKGFNRWRQTFAKRRSAQQQPTHWGLDNTCPLVGLLGRIEPGDRALVIGQGAEAQAYLLAAHDADISFWDADFGVCDRVEQKMKDECLATQFFSCCVPLARWIPSHGAPYDILVLDMGALADYDARCHPEIIDRLQELTAEGGVHVLLHSRSLVPEAVYSFYGGWEREAPVGTRRSAKARGAVLVKPAPPKEEEQRFAERA
jgi:hypothetical protein